MKRLVLLRCHAWAFPAPGGAAPRPIPSVRLQGLFTFESIRHNECRKVNPKLVARWDKGFYCMPPAPDAPPHKYVAKCGAQSGKDVFLVFRTRAECLAEHDADPVEPAGEPAQ
jgi:hypothetical protein